MISINDMQNKLKEMLLEKRYLHSVGVMETAQKLARIYGANEEDAKIAGLLHDCAKNFSYDEMYHLCDEYSIELDDISKNQPGLIHAYLGAEVAKREFGIDSDEIYDAIYYHTIGKPNMPLLTKIIYLSDSIEPMRKFEGVDRLRELAYEDINKALIYQIDHTIKSVLSKGTLLHKNTVDTRNYYLRLYR